MADTSAEDTNTVMLYVGTYDATEDLQTDYQLLKELHADRVVGTYDAALIVKDQGNITIRRHSVRTKYGAWTGLAIGTVIGLFFPPALILDAATGTVAGALAGHFFSSIPAADLKELGQALGATEKALVVVADVAAGADITKAMRHAKVMITREVSVDTVALREAIDRLAQ
jgi:uncharacterized membrane protein